ncbi:MAG: hypothetical protein FJX02_00485 [Alphaproteobacteria bacterium]|nr:hypothetical protein [Alphaproteobacteria bacterium]
MIRPGLAFALWLALVCLLLANNMIGDTWIAQALGVRAVEWYETLVPLPYVLLLALIHARRTRGPGWRGAALLAGGLWTVSVLAADYAYARLTFDEDVTVFLDRFAVQWGAPYPLLILAVAGTPYALGALFARSRA